MLLAVVHPSVIYARRERSVRLKGQNLARHAACARWEPLVQKVRRSVSLVRTDSTPTLRVLVDANNARQGHSTLRLGQLLSMHVYLVVAEPFQHLIPLSARSAL